MPLEKNSKHMLYKRFNEFERLRLNNVPRYLFRAFNRDSGGGPGICTNSPIEIVPAGLMHRQRSNIYAKEEASVFKMVEKHYHTLPCSTEFSSWAASLHQVLHWAQLMNSRGKRGVHIAVLDSQRLKGRVRIWHVPHLLHERGDHEYMVHGRVAGAGYVAVPFKELEKCDLLDLCAELKGVVVGTDLFGIDKHQREFVRTCVKDLPMACPDYLQIIRDLGALFGGLEFPVVTALFCMVPQDWFMKKTLTMHSVRQLEPEEARNVYLMLGSPEVPEGLAREAWLKPGNVSAENYWDVLQWIELLGAIGRLAAPKVKESA
ncbi:hypothetical protein EJ04DRAFT_598309 [Polyplosphaeria fusca]|uniref:DUF7587 domain-containing protein n=1 Tax=Polyplosphaeria fusca TaxID=682080 RepID=A0A9P4V342_9PLEO|nr:hypothetical protein EJ04DRAFT_598309 [Polyplosphaeria fusca]